MFPDRPSSSAESSSASWRRHWGRHLWLATPLVGLLLWWAARHTFLERAGAVLLWAGVNGLLAAAMVIRGVWGVRAVFKARGTLLRWAFWMSLAASLLWASEGLTFVRSSVQSVDGQPQALPPGLVYLLSLFVLFPVVMAFAVLQGIMGAGGGLIIRGRRTDPAEAARSGVRWMWTAVTVAALASLLVDQGSRGIFHLSVPWLFLCLSPFAGISTERDLPARLDQWLAARARLRVFGRTLDLRAGLFSGAGFLAACGLAGADLLTPLRSSALLSGLQFRDAAGFHRTGTDRRMVLLEWDAVALRMADAEESEAAVQARLIRRLAAMGVSRTVIFPPGRRPPAVPSSPGTLNTGAPPAPPAREVPEEDLARLADAMKAAGNVVLLAPEDFRARPGWSRLAEAAARVASPRLPSFLTAGLPMVPFQWRENEPPPAPLLLFAAGQSRGDLPPLRIPGDGTADFAGVSFPLIDHDTGVLVETGKDFAERRLARIDAGEVLRGDWQPVPVNGKGPGRWVPPEAFFKDRMVFLPPLPEVATAGRGAVDGPAGLLALATETLFTQAERMRYGGSTLRPATGTVWLAVSFLCALAAGALSMRQQPIRAGWRLVALVSLIAAGSLLLFLGNVWLDPVLPAVSAALSFLLVSQLSFSIERRAKERSRLMLQRFLDPLVARRLLDSDQSHPVLGGTRETVVVLFADVRGFSQFAESQPPEEVMRVVNSYLEVMTEGLHAEGGILDKYTGDGLMALFRLEQGATAAGAVSAALMMNDAAIALSSRQAAGGGHALSLGISMHVGEAVVGLVGSSRHQINFTALGHAVVVAARLQTLAAGGEVIISREMQEMVREGFLMEPRPEVRVKGVSNAVNPYRVIRRQ